MSAPVSASIQSLPFAGRVAVVTGASSGLGLAFARLLADAGAAVVVGALPGSGVGEAVASLRAAGHRATGVELDVADADGHVRLRDAALALGGLDLWVNNAGASGVYGPSHLTPPEVFERVLDANVRGVFGGTRTAVATMLDLAADGRTRHVVNVWGKGADRAVPFQGAYSSSKAWNRSFTTAVRGELKGTGVRVHGFDPGLVRTPMLARVHATPGMEKRLAALPYVVGLWGQTPEVAAAPLLELLGSDRDDHRDLTLTTMVARGVRSVLAGNLRRSRRIALEVTCVE